VREAFRTAWANPYVKILVLLIALYALWRLFVAVRPAGTIFIAAFGLAYLANPFVDRLHGRGLGRGVGVALLAIIVFASALHAWQFAIAALDQAIREADNGLMVTDAVAEWFERLPTNVEQLLPRRMAASLEGPLAWLDDVMADLPNALSPYLERAVAYFYETLSAAAFGIFQVVVIIIVAGYVLYDFPRIKAALLSVFPIPYQPKVQELATTLDEIMGEYVRAQLFIAAMVGVMVYLGLMLVGVPLAGFIGVLAGTLNIVPFLGSVVPVIPAVILALPGGWVQISLVLVVFVVANQIDNHVLTPMVQSRVTRIHPVAVILAVIGGFALGGIVVAILAVPAVAFAKAIIVRYYQESALYRGG
jgi:predicted PurR-regulated permease PerM